MIILGSDKNNCGLCYLNFNAYFGKIKSTIISLFM